MLWENLQGRAYVKNMFESSEILDMDLYILALYNNTGSLIHADVSGMKYADLDQALMSVKRKVWININVKWIDVHLHIF